MFNEAIVIRKPLLTGVRAVAVLEAAKGGVVLLAGLGLLTLIHRNVQDIAGKLVRLSHLDPASRYPRIVIDAAAQVTDTRLWLLAGAAGIYAVVRAIEAYGLWHERRWAEWFALVSAAIYVPLEIYELVHHATWLKALVLAINLLVVAYLSYALLHWTDQQRELRQP